MSTMDWRLLPENRAIAERLDAVSASFPFYSNFLEVYKKVEEKIKARNEKRLRNAIEDEACNSDAEGEAEESTSEGQHDNKNRDQREASDNTENWKNAGNHGDNHSSFTFGDCEDTIKPINGFINGHSTDTTENEFTSDASMMNKVEPQQAAQAKNVLHSDGQSTLKHLPAGRPGNVDRQHISTKETTNHEQDENNFAATEEREGKNVSSSERNSRSPSTAELDGNNSVESSFSRSECDVVESAPGETSHPDESGVGNEICSDGVNTRYSSESEVLTAEGHDLCEDDEDEESDLGFGRLETRMEAEEINDDNIDEDITDSDDESSDSEKLRWLHLSNYLTMVNLVPGKNLDRARRWNEKVFRRHSTNFIALRNKVNLYMMLSLPSDSTFVSSALETLECLEGVAKDRKEMLMAKAEVAAIHERIARSSNDLLDHSVPLYEEVLQEVDDHVPPVVTLSDSIFRDLAALWKRELADAYLELMGAAKTVLERHGHTQSTLFSRIKDILQSIVYDEDVSKHIRAKAYIKLADVLIYYLSNVDKENRNPQLYEDINIDECFRQARSLDPDDPDVLLRTARQQRLRAKTPDELTEVIEVLSCCVNKLRSEKGEQKDVALHHLGLAYRSLWLKTGLHTTPQMRVYFRSSALRDANGFSPPVGCLVIKPPKIQLEPALVPRPYKNPPKHILLNSNPITRTDDPNLVEARNCFLEADSLTSEQGGCLYPVEVARTYICSGDKKKVQEYLERAHQRKTIGENGVYLYEQMGLFEESTLTDDWNATAYDLHLEKIKSIYREAIRYDTRGARSTVASFYRLLEILYGQIQTMEDDLIRQTEYFLLYMTIQQTERPEEMVRTMTDDDIKIGLMWRLVEMFHKRNGPHDAAAAFTYLSIITTAKKLAGDVKDISLTIQEKQRLLLESTESVALERTVQPRYIPQSYQWLCYLDDIGNEDDSTAYNSSFGILIDTKRSAELKAVSGILRKQFCLKSIEVIRGSGLPDVLSKESLESVVDTLRKCVSVVVITKKGSIHNQRILSVVEAFCSGSRCNRRRICQAVCADVEESELISGVPAWYIDKESVSSSENQEREVNQACGLLRALFMRQEQL